MVYIDTPKNGWSHLVASSIKELHIFASEVNLKRSRFENKRGKKQPHYDVRVSEIQKVVDNGVIQIGRKELFVFLKETYL